MKILKTIGFWFVQCTWGFIMTFIGAVATLGFIIAGKKPQHLGPVVYIQTGKNWGGVNFGPFYFCCENATMRTKLHEAGHGIQNMIWGPLFPFLVAIPSITRCGLRLCKTHLTKSLFNLFYLLIALIVTTAGAVIFGPVIDGFKWLTIVFEVLRLYFLCVSIWMSVLEIPKYDKGYVEYDSIWFEGQATLWGYKYFGKYYKK